MFVHVAAGLVPGAADTPWVVGRMDYAEMEAVRQRLPREFDALMA